MLIYLLSLPERLVRAAAALLGGLTHRLLEFVLPGWARGSRVYQATIDRMLRIILELIGGVQGVFPADEISAGELAKRKAAGNLLEVVSFALTGWSPVWLLAIASDLSGGTRLYLHTLVEDLKQEGALPPETTINSVEDLLSALEGVSGQGADMVDLPPLDLGGMRASWQELRQRAAELPGPEELARIWAEMQAVAQAEGRTMRETSALMAASAARAGLQLGNVYVFEYYRGALRAIAEIGLWRYLRQSFRPYLSMATLHLDPRQPTYTERAAGSRAARRAGETTRRTWRRLRSRRSSRQAAE